MGDKKFSYNLVDEPWVPCQMPGSGAPETLSLRDVLARAHEVREVSHQSPLVTAALHRLLLAVLHRVFGPADYGEWQRLWGRGRFDPNAVAEYLAAWRRRFDLFSEGRPFYQVGRMERAIEHPAALLAQEAATGNNATLFDHSRNDRPRLYTAAEAARYLLAQQAYAIGFGKSDPFYFRDGPLTRGISVLAVGRSLFETLLLNMMPYTSSSPVPPQAGGDGRGPAGEDMPFWEQDFPEEPESEGSPVRGYTDYLTWQSRRIHLIPEEIPGGGLGVRRCQLQQRLRLPSPLPRDPFKAYYEPRAADDGGAAAVVGPLPVKYNTARAVWRDSHALIQRADATRHRPLLFDHLAEVERARAAGEIEAEPRYAVAVYGLAFDPQNAASVLAWGRERLPLPLSYLRDDELLASLGRALKLADAGRSALRSATLEAARLLVSPSSEKGGSDAGASAKAEDFGAESTYWSRLETPFRRLMSELPQADPGEGVRATEEGEHDPRLSEWARTVRVTAAGALAETTRNLRGSARSLRAAAQGDSLLRRYLRKALADYPEAFEAEAAAAV